MSRAFPSPNDLSGPIPPELGRLAKLSVLALGSNGLTGPIPPELGNLASLERLHLFDNDLSGSVPPELSNLDSLRVFELAGTGVCVPGVGRLVRWIVGMESFGGSYCNESDVAVLESLHESTGGPNWLNSAGWLSGPRAECVARRWGRSPRPCHDARSHGQRPGGRTSIRFGGTDRVDRVADRRQRCARRPPTGFADEAFPFGAALLGHGCLLSGGRYVPGVAGRCRVARGDGHRVRTVIGARRARQTVPNDGRPELGQQRRLADRRAPGRMAWRLDRRCGTCPTA